MPKIVEDETIYRATVQMVIERGYAGATTKQIAEAAGTSEVTLFRKYGNKAQLVKQAIAATLEQMDIESTTFYSGDAAADLLRVVQRYQETADKSGQFFAIAMTEMPRYPELADVLHKPLDVMSSIGALLARYQAEGVLRTEHPLHAVAALLGPLNSATMIRAASLEGALPPIDLHDHVALYLNGRIRS